MQEDMHKQLQIRRREDGREEQSAGKLTRDGSQGEMDSHHIRTRDGRLDRAEGPPDPRPIGTVPRRTLWAISLLGKIGGARCQDRMDPHTFESMSSSVHTNPRYRNHP